MGALAGGPGALEQVAPVRAHGGRDAGSEAAVFVDASGARSRWLVRTGRLLGAACACYLAATTLSVIGAPWVPRLSLPAIGPVVPAALPHRPSLPADALATPLPAAASAPPGGLPSSPAGNAKGSAAHGFQSSGGAPGASASVTQAPTTAAHGQHGNGPPTTPTTQVSPTSAPPGKSPSTSLRGNSGSAPGRTKHG